jgi:DNA-binding IclR family transcriptional regulator
MRVKAVKYGRVKNLGNFQTERLEVEVDVDQLGPEATAVAAAIEHARTTVHTALGIKVPKPSYAEVEYARQILRRHENS